MNVKHKPYHQPLLDFLRDLVRIPSVNGRDGERAVAERIVLEAERLGLAGQLVAKNPHRPNAVVSWGQGDKGFAIIGHMDTVEEGEASAWSHSPFGADIQDGKLYGRGTGDNKAGIAIGLYTLAAIRDQQLLDPNEVTLIVAGVADEEAGACSDLGVRYLLDNGHLPVQGAIYAYASDIVCIGHRGLVRLVLTAKGKATHSGLDAWSKGEGGVNAVTGLAEILVALEKLKLPYEPHPAFDHLGFTITPGTLISGGEFESMVPAFSTATVDIRLMPGQSEQHVLTAVQTIVDQVCEQRTGLTVDIHVKNSLPAAAISADHRLAQIAQRHAENQTGVPWAIRGAGPANEGYMLINAGIPTLPGFGPTGGNAHAPDEWVDVVSLGVTVGIFAGIICEYLTIET
jgi:acetylornithine deacetylase/succinyl-diaminopimelate desuccinylase-like protein